MLHLIVEKVDFQKTLLQNDLTFVDLFIIFWKYLGNVFLKIC
jgi:hypothetical protein